MPSTPKAPTTNPKPLVRSEKTMVTSPHPLHAKRHRLRRWLLYSLAIVVLCAALLQLGSWLFFKPVQHPRYGATFSKEQAQYFGVDWRQNYLALLDDLQLRHFRLTSYWDSYEPTRGQFDFTDLDWQIQQAAKHGATVSLAIGLRQPRWPECHQPTWAAELRGNEYKQALYAYIAVVVDRYKNNPTVTSWQLENEAVNSVFGDCDPPDRQRLREEFALVKKIDPRGRVIMSLSDQHGLPLRQPVPDVYGFSVYRIVYNPFGPHFYVTYPTPVWYHRLRAAIIKLIHDRPVIVHELQLEPWGPTDTKQLSRAEQDRSMNTRQIHKNIDFARRTGLQDIDLWGSEWWYWRKVNGDDSVWRTVKTELQATHEQ